MNNNICVICLEPMICNAYNCNNCSNDFHMDCIKKLKKRMSFM